MKNPKEIGVESASAFTPTIAPASALAPTGQREHGGAGGSDNGGHGGDIEHDVGSGTERHESDHLNDE